MDNPLLLIAIILISALLTLATLYLVYVSVRILRVSEALLDETIIIRKETITIRKVSEELRALGATQVDLLRQIPSVKVGSGIKWFEAQEGVQAAMDGKQEGTLLGG